MMTEEDRETANACMVRLLLGAAAAVLLLWFILETIDISVRAGLLG